MLHLYILLQVTQAYTIIFSLLISGLLFFAIIFIVTLRKYEKKTKELKNTQQQHIAKIDILRKEHSDSLEKINEIILKREDDRNFQWVESEKEMLNVLNGLSMLLDVNEKFGRLESEKILGKLDEIANKIKSLTNHE